VYVPTLAHQIHLYNMRAAVEKINFIGFAVGNPCTHPDECYTPYNNYAGNSPYFFQQLNDHGFFSFTQWDQYQSLQCGASTANFNSQQCVDIENLINDAFDYNNIYDIYRYCYIKDGQKQKLGRSQGSQRRRVRNLQSSTPSQQFLYDCSESYGADAFFNN